MEPMQDGIEVGRRENDRVHHNEGKEHHEEKPSVAELRRLAIQPHFSGKKPGKRIQAKKVKNVLRGKTQAKADCAQVVPSPRTLVRIRLLGATVEITSQQGEKGERRFLFRKPIQRHWQGRNCPEKARRKRSGNTHHSTAKQIKDCGGDGTQ